MQEALNIVVLISGSGTNLQAIISHIQQGNLPARISAVISNNADAYGLQRARQADIPTVVVEHRDYGTREAFDQQLAQTIDAYQPELVVLAGFMRILSDAFVKKYQGKMINIHPSLLPKYRGLNTHQRVLDAGEIQHGASVHYVVPELDSGPVILQAAVDVAHDDDAASLAQRVHEVEHQIYPAAIKLIATQRVRLQGNEVLLDGEPVVHEETQNQ